MTRTDHSPEKKAAAMAALLSGQSVGAVAKEYEIPVGTVKGWKRKARQEVGGQPVASPKKEEIGELLVAYLDANLRSLKAQAEVFADKEWLKEQSADELAVLHGVQTDKAIRLLEAMSRVNDGDAS